MNINIHINININININNIYIYIYLLPWRSRLSLSLLEPSSEPEPEPSPPPSSLSSFSFSTAPPHPSLARSPLARLPAARLPARTHSPRPARPARHCHGRLRCHSPVLCPVSCTPVLVISSIINLHLHELHLTPAHPHTHPTQPQPQTPPPLKPCHGRPDTAQATDRHRPTQESYEDCERARRRPNIRYRGQAEAQTHQTRLHYMPSSWQGAHCSRSNPSWLSLALVLVRA